MSRERSFRRHQQVKWKNRVKKFLKTQGVKNITEKEISRRASTRKSCSCEMCGNPRYSFNQLTAQEIKSELDWRDQLDELEEEGLYYDHKIQPRKVTFDYY